MTAGASRAAPTITQQPALAPSPQPRPAPTARALPSGLVAQGGQNCTPIRGQICKPIDTFVFGFEADCGTEPLETADPERSSIRNKFVTYLSALDQDVPRQQFGATTFLIPFVTTTRARMHSMMALLHRLEPGAFG